VTDFLPLVIAALRDLARQRVIPSDIAELALAEDTVIDDLGIDSVGKLNLVSELEDRADVGISEGALQGRRTLGDMAKMLAELKR
jgi:acyl carrier protein